MNKHRVLVVDDDELVHMTIELLFDSEEDFELLHAKNGMEALEIVKNTPDLSIILMDYKMPEFTGALTTQKALLLNKNLKVFMNSGEITESIEKECLSAGAIGFLKKNSPDLVKQLKLQCGLI